MSFTPEVPYSRDDASPPAGETFTYADTASRKFAFASGFWALVTFAMFAWRSHELITPAATLGIPTLNFNRLSAAITFLTPLALVANAVFAGIYFSLQRLTKTRLFAPKLATIHYYLWQVCLLVGAYILLNSDALPRPADAPHGLRFCFWLLLLVPFGVNLFGTIVRRSERRLFVSIWFYLAAFVLAVVAETFHLFADFPGLQSTVTGVRGAVFSSFFGPLSTTAATLALLGVTFYFLPKAAERPLPSRKLSILGFWSLALFLPFTGPARLAYTPTPEWLGVLALLATVGVCLPGMAGPINLLSCAATSTRAKQSPALRCFAAGLLCLIACFIDNAFFAYRPVLIVAQFSDADAARRELFLLGFVAFTLFGVAHDLVPRLYQSTRTFPRLAAAHLWFCVVGLFLYVCTMHVAGFGQGAMLLALDDKSRPVTADYVDVVFSVQPLHAIAAVGAMLYFIGVVLGFVAFVCGAMSNATKRVAETGVTVVVQAPLPARPASELDVVAQLGTRVEALGTLWFHHKWERSIVPFVVLPLLGLGVCFAVAILPATGAPPAIASVRPLTPLERVGRQIFISENCSACHTQLVRPIYAETRRYGDYSKAGESAYDAPTLFGDRRIGPDLAREGMAGRSDYWQFQHLQSPRGVVKDSVMPNFDHLAAETVDFTAADDAMNLKDFVILPPAASQQAEAIGIRFANQSGDPANARFRNRKIVALVAYLQRLGTDLSNGAPANGAAPGAAPVEQPLLPKPSTQPTASPPAMPVVSADFVGRGLPMIARLP